MTPRSSCAMIFDEQSQSYFVPQRAIATFVGYVTIEESGTDKLTITEHPVQEGASITDHAFKEPSTQKIKALFSAEDAPLSEVYQSLLKLQSDRIPFDVVTGKRTYKNMLLEELSVRTDGPTENVLSASLDLKEIVIVSVSTVTVPESSQKQANPGKTASTENAGKKQAEEMSSPDLRPRSIGAGLYGL